MTRLVWAYAGRVLDRSALFHDLALAFGAKTGLPSLAVELGLAIRRHLPIVEVELARQRDTDRALLLVIDPESGRRWTGERSIRALEPMRAELGRLVACEDEVGRVGLEPIAGRLRLGLDRHVLGIAFSRRSLDALVGEARVQLLAVLAAHARQTSVLIRTASCSRRAHQRLREPGPPTSERSSEPAPPEPAPRERTSSEVPVFADAQRDAIARALATTKGKIYGSGGAAELLGLKPSTLQSKMRKLGLDRTSFVAE